MQDWHTTHQVPKADDHHVTTESPQVLSSCLDLGHVVTSRKSREMAEEDQHQGRAYELFQGHFSRKWTLKSRKN